MCSSDLGTCVTVRLHVVAEASGDEGPEFDLANADADIAAGTIKGFHILVVEDTFANRLVVEGFLKRLGVRFQSAENGSDAVECVRNGQFDLVLMDCQMPVMNGYDATQLIRQIELAEGRAHMPIIALTAGAFEEDRKRCLDSGMDDFLPKPINFVQLVEMLRKWSVVDSSTV